MKKTYSEIIKANEELDSLFHGKEYQIAILSNIIINPIKDILEYVLRMQGVGARVQFGNYDNIVQSSDLFKKSNAVIVFWEISNILDGLQYKANVMSKDDINQLISRVKSEINLVLSNVNNTSLVLFNKFTTLQFNYSQNNYNTFDRIASELNEHIQHNLPKNVYLVEIDKILSKVSIPDSVDFRFYYSSKSLYSIPFYQAYADFITPILLSANGKTKKLLLFDCDNTLWKGIVGEDGFDNIKMSCDSQEGRVFEEVQSLALQLNQSGILLGLCSKNNFQDIEEILHHHPDMKLKSKHITIKEINWNDKVSNIRNIANKLNIGLDSIVMVDDSDFEVNLIKETLPEVVVLQVPSQLYQYPQMLRDHFGLFLNLSQSEEDAKRVQMYKQESERKDALATFTNIEDYLKSLKLCLQISTDKSEHVPRLSQLTQKTNQFNFTTKRYAENDLKNFVNDANALVFDMIVTDKFGNYGIVGVAIIVFDQHHKSANIDTLLMSCRILGRNIEMAFINHILIHLKQCGLETLKSEYIKTSKNEQVADLYEKFNFTVTEESDDHKNYELNVTQYQPSSINYIQIICTG